MRWKRMLQVVGAHCEGEVGNVLVGGLVDLPGESVFQKMLHLEAEADDIRRLLLFEPRGGPTQALNVLVPPTHPRADVGFVIMEATKYPVMSGSNAICVATVVLETGIKPMIEPETRLCMEAPAGLIEVRCQCADGKVQEVEFTNVPSFVLAGERAINVSGLGTMNVRVAYGGIFYAIVEAKKLGLQITPGEAGTLAQVGLAIRSACNELNVVHPLDNRISGIANVLFTGELERQGDVIFSTNAVMCGHGRLDRSPCGTGTAARLALLFEQGLVAVGETFVHRSPFGTRFRSRIIGEDKAGNLAAVRTTIAGRAWITGLMSYGLDPSDPIQGGHTPSDVWPRN